ncbi:hypothetical protein MCNF_22230 [Mycolicibacterium confluentis]|uniref:Uncharacterized protein n=1 Tax=Mycolicibacterium confluentis TaxID=28047 RepID=A0A7I7XWG2_9MYCO|nr:hypothetical protein MCNF_22230 [Mycolicibacterium confluentis]
MPFTSFDDYWQGFLGGQGPAGAFTASLTDPQREALKSRLRDCLSPSEEGPLCARLRGPHAARSGLSEPGPPAATAWRLPR